MKCAWIDHLLSINFMFGIELRAKGIQVDARESLREFLADFDLSHYPVLLFHPGVKNQHRLLELRQNYPHTRVALITAVGSGADYKNLSKDISFLTYNADLIESFIKETYDLMRTHT